MKAKEIFHAFYINPYGETFVFNSDVRLRSLPKMKDDGWLVDIKTTAGAIRTVSALNKDELSWTTYTRAISNHFIKRV